MATNIEPTPNAAGTGFDGSIKFIKAFGTLIGSVVVAAGTVTAVWNEPSLELRLAVFGVVGLITAFVGYAQVINPWLARRRQQKVIGLVEADEVKPTEFRLRPYEQADHDEFDRPDDAHNKALAWLDEVKATCLYLTGFSGTGKSSLLQAWLIPELAVADRPAVTVVVRSFADPIKQLVTALKDDEAVPVDLPKDETDARALLEQVASAMSARHGRLLIAIDQFEECLILQDDQTKAKLALLFKDLQENPIEDLQLLFVLRTDYLKFDELTALGLPDPRPRENWFNLEALSHADARKILRQTLPDLSETLENEVIKEASVVDDLPGLIRPITLNMMGLVLKRFAGSALTETTPGKLIQDFLKKVMAKPGIEQVAPDLLAEMITEQGTKKPSAEAELAAATENAPALVRKTLYLLGEEGVVRELDRSQNIWEISHDFVARQLGQIIPRLKPSRWQRVQLAATPVALASWLVILGAGYPIYQILKEQIAYNALQAESVTILGKHGTYKILFDSLTEHGAINRVLDHAAELHPASLEINSDQAGTRLPSLDKLTSLTSLTINDNNQLAAIPSLDKLTSLTINGNNQLAAIPSLEACTNLNNVQIWGNENLIALPALGDSSRFEVFAFDAGYNMEASIAALKSLPETTLIKADWDFLQEGYAEQLNEARRQLGLAPAKVAPISVNLRAITK